MPAKIGSLNLILGMISLTNKVIGHIDMPLDLKTGLPSVLKSREKKLGVPVFTINLLIIRP